MTMAIGIERGHLRRDDRVALLGIGSGINVIMLGVEWQTAPLHVVDSRRQVAAAGT
jgi:3-oxoacyl-[acyl-carrier-protein] synthase-3